MSLRPLLGLLAEDPSGRRLGEGSAKAPARAFVSSSLRPYVIAALTEIAVVGSDGPRPTLVVVGDDRAARELAGDLRVWLHPRRVRWYPSRGVTYESHLTPPAHLIGLRVAALDALLEQTGAADGHGTGADAPPPAAPDGRTDEREPPVVVVSAVALSEKVPDPSLRPRSFTLRTGELLDLHECAAELTAAGYERVDQVEERGQFAVRGEILDIFPATEERAVRVDMFDVEIESLKWFSTFTQRSLGDVEEVEIAPAAELAAEHRELAEIAAIEDASERPDIAELLPVERFGALLDLLGSETELIVAAEEELAPALDDHWGDVCAAFHDTDAHHLYVSPEEVRAALAARVRVWLSSLSAGQEIDLRAQSADVAARSLAEAEPQMEKLVRSGYRTVVAFPRRGEGERAAYNLARLKATWMGTPPTPGGRSPSEGGASARAAGTGAGGPASASGSTGARSDLAGVDVGAAPIEASLRFAAASLREGFIAPSLKLAAAEDPMPTHPSDPARPEGTDAGGGRCAPSPSCAPATSSSTRTTGSHASRASRRAPWRASRATTSTSNTQATTASTRRPTSSRRSPATSAPAPRTRRSPNSGARAGRR
jgi:UvrB interaction domain